jgi:hypothetical protein
MKKLNMKEINKSMEEFDKFIQDDNAEFICNLIAAGLAALSAAMVAIGQYAKNNKEEN